MQVMLSSGSSNRPVTVGLFSKCCNWGEVGLSALIREVMFAQRHKLKHEQELDGNFKSPLTKELVVFQRKIRHSYSICSLGLNQQSNCRIWRNREGKACSAEATL